MTDFTCPLCKNQIESVAVWPVSCCGRRNWQDRTVDTPLPALKQRGGPGTELTNLLSSIGVSYTNHCKCKKRANIMDRGGVSWCRDNLDEIVGWLTEEAERRGWPPWRWSARTMVMIAVRRAERSQQASNRSGLILEAGLPRMGSRSLTHAMKLLGYHAQHGLTLEDAEQRMAGHDWSLLERYDCVTHLGMWASELIAAYSGTARFIVLQRDFQSWSTSLRQSNPPQAPRKLTGRPEDYLAKALAPLIEAIPDASKLRSLYDAHYEQLKSLLPRGTLWLDICAGNNWQQLCPWLGDEKPQRAFPHIRHGRSDETQAQRKSTATHQPTGK